ncbi:uncharacterized protein PHACADRAFT_86540 [Phanerochaete carnosa HHB-10118-sp]|uniref:Uncharacterized protein n=1 Tax=Phanerochaete carnosa (strain HHB-10118-sp) TaxID=650164 RepID=K5W575_PHACS|nr:uncharacterized protein PHACADRAFT_86540 [Phanerochaete carnosa HHB-10118-sp]EKM59058.1 hypothetical protein PHACADRAFT_86540 [Phanerochaete carnosa HHB-10118-sp]
MFLFYRPPSAPDEIYSSSLATLHEGHALWYPEPHESGELQIGDVGFMSRGAFIRLFNLDTSAPEKKVTFWPTPFEDIEPLPPHVLQIDRRRRPLLPTHYRSHGVESRQIHASADVSAGTNVSVGLSTEYTCKAAQGAVLALKSQAYAESIFENLVLKKYIMRNHDKWYAYVKGVLGQDIKPEDIVVVRGWVKTEADWAAAAFSNTSTSSSVSLEGQVGGVAGLDMGTSYTSSMTGPMVQRQGEYLEDTSVPHPPEAKRDQSVFVRRFKMRRRFGFLKKIVAGAGYHRLPDPGDARGGSGGGGIMAQGVGGVDEASEPEFEGESTVYDPLDILIDYIFEVRPTSCLVHHVSMLRYSW